MNASHIAKPALPKNNNQAYFCIVKLETAFNNAILQQFQALSARVSKLELTAKWTSNFNNNAFQLILLTLTLTIFRCYHCECI